ncbi:MAG: hypothetical protein CMC38_00595 [Flavobacteriaceae bacterium]|nr:hypothetical protein [Flavobacteriaceae bacterium]|tara:strand:+ start:1114 stop:1617 length:504 start_codon:yes stop_codon:yes gene_type:complete
MKNYILLFSLIGLFISCAPNCEVATNGFGPYEGQTVFMGSDSSVDVVKEIDAAWVKRDYDALKALISDGGNFTFSDGLVVNTGEEFASKVEEDYQKSLDDGQEWGWNIDYAFSVKPRGSDDPAATNQDGEWVNAQFTGQDGVYIEWYQIVDGKLVSWFSAKNPGTQE